MDQVLAPIDTTRKRYYAFLVLLGIGVLWFAFAWLVQLRGGMIYTSLRDWGTQGGVPWGVYIGTFIWWIGIAHGGIMISAAVRVFKIERFKPIARIAEILTIVALPMAAANIIFDIGRPDRIFNTIIQWPNTVHHSPLAWDISVVLLYFALSLTYLIFSLRDEIYALRSRLPRHWQPLYGVILLGYTPKESPKIERMTWWLAVAILAIVPLLSGGVVPWLFGLIAAQPGWYGAGTGPAMLTESLTTAIALVLVISAVFRSIYGWEDIIDDEVFRGLIMILVFLTIATLWFLLHDFLVGIYHAPVHIAALSETMIGMPLFWILGGIIAVSHVYFLAQTMGWIALSIKGSVIASIGISLAILGKKILFVVEGLMHPTTPPLVNLYPTGVYTPSWIEISLVVGSIVIAALMFALATKIIPMIELHEEVDSNGS